ncbi:hypothetical protein FOPG_19573 [Fusarium oxysporum f. sp. conglutinans race 2 54008]|uniref:Uncharacterized protein n=2 Tax=Fusarium oxysporum f. sp. conglutinans TaxID=100902 RepID=F9GGE5_FUSOF|nr:hypothetical protein FOXB_17729 [Fusarium oxysporum f. sp. conglutinans Fo5176]EXL64158.1 hypothetical protein FOPG_19573 [Fusarium oxysporum f. sp. conglutinans race 2 54008]
MEITRELKEAVAKQEGTVHDMGKPTVEIKDQMAEEVQSVHEQLETIAANAKGGPQRSYSDSPDPPTIRIDNVSRIVVLGERNEVRTEITEMLGRESDTEVAKIAWLSERDIPEVYGSMVVYLKKRREARRFINEGFLRAGGESGST